MVTDLGTLPRGSFSGAVGINDLGQVVGTSESGHVDKDGYKVSQAFLWEQGRMRVLAPPRSLGSEAVAINSRGQVIVNADMNCGHGDSGYGWTRAFLYQHGSMAGLGTVVATEGYGEAASTSSYATAINGLGRVVGYSAYLGCGYGGNMSVFSSPFTSRNGSTTALGHLPRNGSTDMAPMALNERGQVVGGGFDWDTDTPRAVVWNGDRPTWLDKSAHKSEAHGINASGSIIGAIGTSGVVWRSGKATIIGHPRTTRLVAINDYDQVAGTDASRAFLWQAGRSLDLGVLPGSESSASVALNEAGSVIGYSYTDQDKYGTPKRPTRAWVWASGVLTALPALPGDVSTKPAAINNAGQIVGLSATKDGRTHAVLWTQESG